MSTKVVALQRNPHDEEKVKAIQQMLSPLSTLYYEAHGPIAPFPDLMDKLDYLLFTGGHGNFIDAAPTLMNGLGLAAVKAWAATLTSEFDAIILDTCFSSSFIPIFSPHIRIGGAIVCAHGSGEGFTSTLTDPSNRGKAIGVALADLAHNVVSGLEASYTSLSIYVRSPRGIKLFTTNGGTQRSDGMQAHENMGIADPVKELDQLDRFLIGKLVGVEVLSLEDLKTKLKNHLKMVI